MPVNFYGFGGEFHKTTSPLVLTNEVFLIVIAFLICILKHGFGFSFVAVQAITDIGLGWDLRPRPGICQPILFLKKVVFCFVIWLFILFLKDERGQQHTFLEDERGEQHTGDGSVDFKGRPSIKHKTGNWKACPFILGMHFFTLL